MEDRRHFLKQLAGMGALIATSQLPLRAEDKPQVFPKRGRKERLSLSYAVVNIGLAEPFSVLHLSDSHLTAIRPDETDKLAVQERRTRTFGGRQEEALADALAWAKEHVEYLVHTGDLIDWQSEGNFEKVRAYFGDSLLGCLGNHEYTVQFGKAGRDEAYKDVSRERLRKVYPFDISLHSQVVHGVNFVTLDDVYGTVTPAQVERFKAEVQKGLPIVLCMHVPLYTETIWRAHQRFWKGREPLHDSLFPTPAGDYKAQLEDPVTREFIAYLKTLPSLKCILAGHLHITVEDQFSPSCREYVVAGGFLFHGREVLFI